MSGHAHSPTCTVVDPPSADEPRGLMTAVEILDWIGGARAVGFTAESALSAARDLAWAEAVSAAHDADGEPYREPGDRLGRCPLEGCVLPPHPRGTKHYTWRELGRGDPEEISP